MEATIGGTRRHLVDVALEQRRRGDRGLALGLDPAGSRLRRGPSATRGGGGRRAPDLHGAAHPARPATCATCARSRRPCGSSARTSCTPIAPRAVSSADGRPCRQGSARGCTRRTRSPSSSARSSAARSARCSARSSGRSPAPPSGSSRSPSSEAQTIEGAGVVDRHPGQDGPQRHRSGAGRGRRAADLAALGLGPRAPGRGGGRGCSTRRRGRTSPSRPSRRGAGGTRSCSSWGREIKGRSWSSPSTSACSVGSPSLAHGTTSRRSSPRRTSCSCPRAGRACPTWCSRPWRPRVRWWPRRWTGPGTSSRTA